MKLALNRKEETVQMGAAGDQATLELRGAKRMLSLSFATNWLSPRLYAPEKYSGHLLDYQSRVARRLPEAPAGP